MSEKFYRTCEGIYKVTDTFNAWIEPHFNKKLELHIPESGGIRIEKRVTVENTADIIWKVITNVKTSSQVKDVLKIGSTRNIKSYEIDEITAMNFELLDKKGETYVLRY